MDFKDIDEKLVQDLEEYRNDVGIEIIHASSFMDFINRDDFLYFISLIHNGFKQKIAFDGMFIQNNSYDDVVCRMKNQIKESTETLKGISLKNK